MQAVIDSLSTGVPKALKELARLGRTRRISAWPLPCADQRSMSTTRRPFDARIVRNLDDLASEFRGRVEARGRRLAEELRSASGTDDSRVLITSGLLAAQIATYLVVRAGGSADLIGLEIEIER